MSVDICLVSPPKRAFNHHRPPLALMLLASFLEKNGISTEIIDPKSDHDVTESCKTDIVNQIIKRIEELNPRIIGISCYTPEYNDVIELARKLKEKRKGTKIVVGGVHATLRPKEFFFKDSPIDFVVIGEGEITLNELAGAILKRDRDFRHIPGIGFFDKVRNEYFQTDARPLIHDLDAMPFPAYEKVDMEREGWKERDTSHRKHPKFRDGIDGI